MSILIPGTHIVTKSNYDGAENNPVVNYLVKNASQESETLRKLREVTSTLSNSVMLCAPEEAQLFSLILKLMDAKKVIEIGVDHKVDIKIQPALKTLDELLASGEAGSYDFAFIDADKTGYDAYYERVLQLLRPRGLIAIDNVFYGGMVFDTDKHSNDKNAVAIHKLNRKVHKDSRVVISMLPVADGVTLAMKL